MHSFRIARAAAAAAITFVLAPVLSPGAGAQRPAAYSIAYRIAMPDPAAHLDHIAIDVGRLAGDSLILQMPV
ncbi:MAG: hypothetical protein ACRENQ_03355 [Gemmatimonadaceae bacterium]